MPGEQPRKLPSGIARCAGDPGHEPAARGSRALALRDRRRRHLHEYTPRRMSMRNCRGTRPRSCPMPSTTPARVAIAVLAATGLLDGRGLARAGRRARVLRARPQDRVRRLRHDLARAMCQSQQTMHYALLATSGHVKICSGSKCPYSDAGEGTPTLAVGKTLKRRALQLHRTGRRDPVRRARVGARLPDDLERREGGQRCLMAADARPRAAHPVLPLLALLFAGLTYYGARGSLANFVLPWQHAYGSSRGGVSLIVTASFLSIGAAQIVGGRLLERVDAWKVLAVGPRPRRRRLRARRHRHLAAARGARGRRHRGLRRRSRRQLDAVRDGDAALPRAPRRALRPDRRRHRGRLGRDAADLAHRARRLARDRAVRAGRHARARARRRARVPARRRPRRALAAGAGERGAR